MIQSTICRIIPLRAAERIVLAATILVVLQGISAAQNNVLPEADANPTRLSTTLAHGVAAPLRIYHDGGIRDISAVGNRDLGCKSGLGSRYSLQEQVQIGRSYAQAVEDNSKLIRDSLITEYVNRIGQTLARNSNAPIPFTFRIIDAADVNAFSLPGGFIFIDSGLILAADNEAELAGVISHEVAHVAACHAAQEMAGEELTKPASMPLILRLAARRMTVNTVYLKPSRSSEAEADFLGVEYLYKTGYDPRALSSFLEKAMAMEKQKAGSRTNASESQSQITSRVEGIHQHINMLLPPGSEYKLDTPEFHEIKNRLSALENDESAGKSHSRHDLRLTGSFPTAATDELSNGDADYPPR